MKKTIILIIFSLVVTNCSTIPKNNIIPYLLSIEAESSIYDNIKNSNKDSIAFYFERLSDNKFKVHLLKEGILDEYSVSNRKLFINDKFYPLIFDIDYKFYVKMKNSYPIVSKFENEDEKKSVSITMPNINERMKNRLLYIRDGRYPRIELSIYWIVDNKGNLLETNSK
jgi:hypothetical protein